MWIGQGVVWKYFPHRGIQFGDRIRIGEYTTIDVPDGGFLILGDDVKFTMGCVVQSIERVEIGRDSLFGEYCSIRDADHGTRIGEPIARQALVPSPTRIGKDVWCGRGVVVLRGIEISDGVVVGANSVVLHDLTTAYGIYVGTPPRLVRERS